MSQRDHNSTGAKRSLSVSVLVGLVLVPLSAYAASVLVSERSPAEPAASTATDFATETASAADLEAACGDVGVGMVATEADGSIGDIEQAALDALREICAQEGMPLPGKPVPPPMTQTVVLADNGPGPTAGVGAEWEVEYDDAHDDDDHDDDRDDDGEDRDDEDHDEDDDD